VIEETAAALAGMPLAIVDSADATALDVGQFLSERGLSRKGPDRGSLEMLVTDLPKSFADIAGRFLGEDAANVQTIDL
jgi:glutamate racemase